MLKNRALLAVYGWYWNVVFGLLLLVNIPLTGRPPPLEPGRPAS